MKQTSTNIQPDSSDLLPDEKSGKVRCWKLTSWKTRVFKDKLAQYSITLGGNSVIVAIVLIFFYLIYEALPLLNGAEIEKIAEYSIDSRLSIGKSYYTIEEQGEIAAKFDHSGQISFFDTPTGRIKKKFQISIPQGEQISSFYASDAEDRGIVYGLSNGSLVVARHEYLISFPGNKRLITPQITFPMGEKPLKIDPSGQALIKVAFEQNKDEATIIALTQDKRLLMSRFVKDSPLYDNEISSKRFDFEIPLNLHQPDKGIQQLLLSKDQRRLFVFYQDISGRSMVDFFLIERFLIEKLLNKKSLIDDSPAKLTQQVVLAEASNPVTYVSFLTGGISILVGQDSGRISQWFPVNLEDIGYQLKFVREFNNQQAAIIQIVPEMQRKGFIALDKQGVMGLYHSTAEKTLLIQQVSTTQGTQLALAPRANFLLTLDAQDKAMFWSVSNEYPEISWHSLWQKVWYESHPQAEYTWQSSSASSDFEPKFSLTPLAFGTFKAAFYAMLFAIPIAIMGAVYTAYFMTPAARGIVKPSIEIMEALPTVILGFLAGLWLAPLVEDNLPAVFSLVFVLPVSILLFALLWQLLPEKIRQAIPEGWEGFILIPFLVLMIWISFALSLPIEAAFFDGDMQSWLNNKLGLGFNQRNSIVIGIAMGFAVIPTIFSITEDAVFNVPKHLTLGSLALGATRWQTLIRVVILTASPAIFSAVMIGFGRAIGETMIVLMATGNTPIMDFSFLQGMRTLSANIAIEVPESEVGSSHYRILFLAALMLFVFTFLFNTVAELIRQNLRKKYSQL